MRKISLLMLLTIGIFLSCDKDTETPLEETAAVSKVAELQKTQRMTDFEKVFTDYGKIQDPKAKQEAIPALVAAAKQYILDNGESIATGTRDGQIINAALDIHLKKINQLRTTKQ